MSCTNKPSRSRQAPRGLSPNPHSSKYMVTAVAAPTSKGCCSGPAPRAAAPAAPATPMRAGPSASSHALTMAPVRRSHPTHLVASATSPAAAPRANKSRKKKDNFVARITYRSRVKKPRRAYTPSP
ncbi:unnamed protein product [Caenorhabditis brenneri]